MKLKFRKTDLYYYVFVLIALVILIANYPRLYGVDAFQLMWMAQALREGAFFSEPTWLISPFSYFGYYPFSHRAIGVPTLLAFLMSFLEFISFGTFGLTEAVFLFNVILILVIYKTSRNLGETLFKEEWSRVVFVASILFSVNFINEYAMTVSTRIIISITMIVLLNINLKLLKKGNKIRAKTILLMLFVLIIGALAHRLWLISVITIPFSILTLIIRKNEKLHHISVLLIFPISIAMFFFGFEYFGLAQYGFSQDSNVLEVSIFLGGYYFYGIGIVTLLFPVGLIIAAYKLTFTFKEYNPFFTKKRSSQNPSPPALEERDRIYYLLLFLIPSLFLVFTTFYAIAVFLPIIVIFSVQGLVYAKNYLSKFSRSSRIKRIFVIIASTLLFTGYCLYLYGYYPGIAFLNITTLSLVLLTLLVVIFLMDAKSRFRLSFKSYDNKQIKGFSWMLLLSLSIFATSLINSEMSRYDNLNSIYPWDNRYVTEEELQIIDFFENEDVRGLIFIANSYISERIGGVAFLPTFSKPVFIGSPLYNEIISPNYVYENSKFSLLAILEFDFFNFTEVDPIQELRNNIRNLDLRDEIDLDTFLSYNIQYLITINETIQPGGINNWPLVQSLKQSDLFEPVYVTKHFVIWKIY